MRTWRVCSMVTVGALLVAILTAPTGCNSNPFRRATETSNLVWAVATALQCAEVDGVLELGDAPSHGERADGLNTFLTEYLVNTPYIDAAPMREGGVIRDLGQGHGPRLVDAWGRPLVFQVPSCCPQGTLSTTGRGVRLVPPLPADLWPPSEYGPVQVWSLGPNGFDDRGEGDDILPVYRQRVKIRGPSG